MDPFINYTAFPAMLYEAIDQNDEGFTIVAARVTYDLLIPDDGRARLKLSPTQSPLCKGDEHYGDPSKSSVMGESDLAPYKPKTDVVINAAAYAPGDKPAPFFGAAVQVGDQSKTVRVTGPRVWRHGLVGWSLEPPKPIASLDLRYEYASGGLYEVDGKVVASPANPVGMGWYPPEYLRQCKKTTLPAPQIESADKPISNIGEIVPPDGFGFIGRGWQGRIEYAGTMDEAWQEERHPLLPRDFRFEYWCGAQPALQLPHPKPLTEIPVALRYLVPASDVPNQAVIFDIPVETVFVFTTTDKGLGVTKDLLLDTVLIDMNARKVFCTYRVALSEELNLVETQLRYIAVDDRKAQQEQAAAMNPDPASHNFIPLPPSLMTVTKKEKRHG